MGIFDRFRKQRAADDGERLFEALQRHVERGDEDTLIGLCRRRSDQIHIGFPQWQKVPDAVRSDPAALQPCANTLIAVARVFAEQLDDPALFERLVGPPADNPLVQLQQAIATAGAAMSDDDYDTARVTLEEVLDATQDIAGTADPLRAVAIGTLGRARFDAGLVREALADFERALGMCRAQGGAEDEAVYRQAIVEAHRWLGEAGGEATHSRVKVWAQIGDRRIDPDTLVLGASVEPESHVRFVFVRDRLSLGSVEALVKRARDHGTRGEHENALVCLEEAIRRDPHDPEPYYVRGQALMHLQRWSDALESYRQTESLAPGWYQCRSDGWLAEQIAEGRAPEAAFDLLVHLEGVAEDEHYIDLLTTALSAWPDAAPLRLFEARALSRMGKRDAAREAAAAGLAVAAEPDVETRLLLELAGLAENPAEREQWLRRAVALGGNLVAKAMAQVMLVAW